MNSRHVANAPLRLALVGREIGHSLSSKMYEQLLVQKFSYDLLDFSNEDEIPSLDVLSQSYDGINITAPYKKHFLNQVHLSDDFFSRVGINCIDLSTKEFMATNTDYSAMESILSERFFDYEEVVLLGSGVMANCLEKIFNDQKINYTRLSRGEKGPLEDIELANFFNELKPLLVVNACSRDFVFNKRLPKAWCFWDLNYSHVRHQQLFETHATCEYVDGLEMLKTQARHCCQFWSFTSFI